MPINDDFGRRIADARERKGMTQGQLAKAAGISQPSLSAIESGDTSPDQVKYGTMARIAAALGSAEFALREGEPAKYNVLPRPNPRTRLPLVSWVSAGLRDEAIDPYAPGAASEWIDFDAPGSKSAICLRVKGDSMVRPDGTGFPNGCYIAVEPRRRPKSGDFVVMRFNDTDEATFKQYFADGPLKMLRPLNTTYPTLAVSPDAQLVGVVFEKRIVEKF